MRLLSLLFAWCLMAVIAATQAPSTSALRLDQRRERIEAHAFDDAEVLAAALR